jgi:fumarylacetoacetase
MHYPNCSVGYHGRSSSIVPSGIPVHRPMGQTLPNGENTGFGPSRSVDWRPHHYNRCKYHGRKYAVTEAEDYILNGFIE